MTSKNTYFSIEERIEIKRLIDKGLSLSEISRQIDRSKNGVIYEVRRFGGRDKYDPHFANEQTKRSKEQRYALLSQKERERRKTPFSELCKKVDRMDMQLDIILEEVMKLRLMR